MKKKRARVYTVCRSCGKACRVPRWYLVMPHFLTGEMWVGDCCWVGAHTPYP